jgi:hypothetical protein
MQPHYVIDTMPRMHEAHTAQEETQWFGMKEQLVDREMK